MKEASDNLPPSGEILHPDIAEIRYFATPDQTAEATAQSVVDFAGEYPEANISYATGKTMEPVLANAARIRMKLGVDFSRTRAFHLDERYRLKTPMDVSAFAPFIMNRAVIPLGIPLDRAHLWNGMAPDPIKEVKRYNDLLAQYPIDLSILGIGTDSHMAFTLPGTPFDRECHFVPELSAGILRRDRVERNEDVPPGALTQGPANIVRATNILLVAYGTEKGIALRHALNGEITPEYPASVLRRVGFNVHIYIDQMAAAALVAPEE